MPIPVFGSFLKKEKEEVGVNCCYSSFFFSFLFPGKLCACPCHSTAWGLGRAPLLSCQSVGRRKSENAEFELTAISRTKNVKNFSRKKAFDFFLQKATMPTINLASFCSILLINDPRLISHIHADEEDMETRLSAFPNTGNLIRRLFRIAGRNYNGNLGLGVGQTKQQRFSINLIGKGFNFKHF